MLCNQWHAIFSILIKRYWTRFFNGEWFWRNLFLHFNLFLIVIFKFNIRAISIFIYFHFRFIISAVFSVLLSLYILLISSFINIKLVIVLSDLILFRVYNQRIFRVFIWIQSRFLFNWSWFHWYFFLSIFHFFFFL